VDPTLQQQLDLAKRHLLEFLAQLEDVLHANADDDIAVSCS
jgi:hypothetical protein